MAGLRVSLRVVRLGRVRVRVRGRVRVRARARVRDRVRVRVRVRAGLGAHALSSVQATLILHKSDPGPHSNPTPSQAFFLRSLVGGTPAAFSWCPEPTAPTTPAATQAPSDISKTYTLPYSLP